MIEDANNMINDRKIVNKLYKDIKAIKVDVPTTDEVKEITNGVLQGLDIILVYIKKKAEELK